MANILPPDAQKEVRRMERARFMYVGALVLLAGALVAFVALLPSLIVLVLGAKHSTLENKKATPEAEYAEERAQILTAKVLVGEISPFVTSASSTLEVLRKALEVRPSGVSVDDIQYERGNSAVATIVFRGRASNRSAIIAFRDALIGSKLFESVSVPASALAGAEDGRFSVTMKGAF